MLYSLLNCVIYWFHHKTYLRIYSGKELRGQQFAQKLPTLIIFCVYVVDLNFMALHLNFFQKKIEKYSTFYDLHRKSDHIITKNIFKTNSYCGHSLLVWLSKWNAIRRNNEVTSIAKPVDYEFAMNNVRVNDIKYLHY